MNEEKALVGLYYEIFRIENTKGIIWIYKS